MGNYVPGGFVVHELQKILIKLKLHGGREFLIGLPELQEHIDVLKYRNAVGNITFTGWHAA